MLNISDRDFKRLVDFVKSNYGIDLSKASAHIQPPDHHSRRNGI